MRTDMDGTAAPAPVRPAERIEALDILRGVAVCGILAVNIFVMGTVAGTQGRVFPAEWNADWLAWGAQRLLLEGPMRGLFTLLFGAGMLLMLRAAEGPRGKAAPIDVWTRRCLALLAIGVVHFAVLMWPGEILWTYGVAGLALLAFRTAKIRTLWLWALLLIACLSLHRAWDTSGYVTTYQAALAGERAIAEGRPPSPAEQAGIEAAAAARAANHPSAETIAAEIRQRTEWGSLFGWSAAGWSFRHLGIYSWIAVAECLAWMLVGMALYRAGILTGTASRRTYWLMLLLGALIGLGLRAVDLAWQARTGFELDIHRMNPLMSILRSGWYQPARLALTLAWVAGLVLMVRGGVRFWRPPFRAMGRMALTVYTLQSALTSLLFYALGYVGAFGAAALLLVALAICLLTAAFSMIWLHYATMGPLERLLRAISYGGVRTRDPPASAPSL
ncbi:MAG TPA: DUF418 domain-containing protein [Allosphingosinicella sp.]|nr:DUF418 domain-containing protein [Allosphingosinicella sp.]